MSEQEAFQVLSLEEKSLEETYEEGMGSLLDHLRTGVTENNEYLRALFGTAYTIDEMAMMFYDAEKALTFITVLVQQDGFELFNHANDIVEVGPLPGAYSVRYWFMNTPWDFRLELMVLGEGFSPYHSGLFQNIFERRGITDAVTAVHASFKVPDEEKYANAVHSLQRSETHELWQHCKSTYGRFSYFGQRREVGEAVQGWALKPRVNLRDAK